MPPRSPKWWPDQRKALSQNRAAVHFEGEGLLVGDTPVKTLRGEKTQLGFGHVQPAAVLGGIVDLEALDQAARFGGREGLVQRSWAMGVEVVLHQDDFVGGREVNVREVGERLGVVDRRTPIGHFHMPPTLERGEHHEQIGGAVAFIFIVKPRRPTRLHRHRHARLGNQLL